MPQHHMMQYQLCDLILESNIPLVELTPATGQPPACTFHLLPATAPRPVAVDWFHQWLLPDGEAWLSFGRWEGDYLLRFSDMIDFLVAVDGRTIRCYPAPDIPPETVRHLLLDQVIPLTLSQQGKLVVHAGAVVLPEGAVAFLGRTGFGKSTLTASFSHQGFPLLSDDCLLVEERRGQLVGIPSYPGLRLWPDMIEAFFAQEPDLTRVAHYSEKKRVVLNHVRLSFYPDAVPLRRIYFLAPPDESNGARDITLTPLRPADAFMELFKHSYHLDITDREKLKEEFEVLGQMMVLPIFSRLAFPRDLALLPAVRECILADLKNNLM